MLCFGADSLLVQACRVTHARRPQKTLTKDVSSLTHLGTSHRRRDATTSPEALPTPKMNPGETSLTNGGTGTGTATAILTAGTTATGIESVKETGIAIVTDQGISTAVDALALDPRSAIHPASVPPLHRVMDTALPLLHRPQKRMGDQLSPVPPE